MVRRCENKFGLNRPSTALTTMGPHLNGLEQHLAPKIQGLGPLRTTITGIDTGTVGEGIQLEMAQKCLPWVASALSWWGPQMEVILNINLLMIQFFGTKIRSKTHIELLGPSVERTNFLEWMLAVHSRLQSITAFPTNGYGSKMGDQFGIQPFTFWGS